MTDYILNLGVMSNRTLVANDVSDVFNFEQELSKVISNVLYFCKVQTPNLQSLIIVVPRTYIFSSLPLHSIKHVYDLICI